ncbi:helix-turn-helix domain-containing protein [Secundilactobacillus kimchicus]|uniref:helix-turn-helix domain-containing protein n=1 Tax=Secundilactobacillus kimchicus TaxID=528209 RepID=UPI000AC74A6C
MDYNRGNLFAKRLYKYMRMRDLTLNRVAKLSGLTASTLNNIINRSSSSRVDTIYRVCNGLHTSVRDFFRLSSLQ